jgi:valyl-tRNA synthetase
MSGFHLGQVPFKKVLIHGLVRAKDGRKFSKSLNNGIDPLDMIEKYGADALRMGLIVGSAIGSDIKFDEQKVRGYKLFANKLWNITRFVLENKGDFTAIDVRNEHDYPGGEVHLAYLQELDLLCGDLTREIDEYHLYLAAEKIYHYIWDVFASVIIENLKVDLKSANPLTQQGAKTVLRDILNTTLKLLHPFMPFVTEEIWGSISDPSHLLMVENWPDNK